MKAEPVLPSSVASTREFKATQSIVSMRSHLAPPVRLAAQGEALFQNRLAPQPLQGVDSHQHRDVGEAFVQEAVNVLLVLADDLLKVGPGLVLVRGGEHLPRGGAG